MGLGVLLEPSEADDFVGILLGQDHEPSIPVDGGPKILDPIAGHVAHGVASVAPRLVVEVIAALHLADRSEERYRKVPVSYFKRAVDLQDMRKSSPEKCALAWLIRKQTSVKTAWIKKRLHMGSATNFSELLKRVEATSKGEPGYADLARLKSIKI